jgi:hypothetical protein
LPSGLPVENVNVVASADGAPDPSIATAPPRVRTARRTPIHDKAFIRKPTPPSKVTRPYISKL